MHNVKLVLDPDDDNFDIDCKVETQGEDDTLEYLITPDLPMSKLDEEEKIHRYLSNDFEGLSQVAIVLDTKRGLYVIDEEGNLYREIEFKKDFTSNKEERIKELIKRLLTIL